MAANEWHKQHTPRRWHKPEPNWQKMPWHPGGQTIHTETVDDDFVEQNKRFQKKRGQYMHQLQDWKTYYYGSPEEQLVSKGKMRKELKRQIKELEEINSYTNYAKQDDSVKAMEDVKRQQEEEQKMQEEQTKKMHAFRDDNKTIMEIQAEQRRITRKLDWKHDQELLQHNPINWSCSLK